MINFLITNLHKYDYKKAIQVYLFGSSLYSSKAKDIDLLIVYNKKYSINEILKVRQVIASFINNELHIAPDICLLSIEEKEYKRFIREENAKLIYP